MFKKYSSYDLGNLTPGNLRLVSESTNGNFRYLKVEGDNIRGKIGRINVAMITEQGQPKIDLPESLRLGFGPDWQQRVNMIEQSYIFARQNLGEEQSQQLVYSLLKKQ